MESRGECHHRRCEGVHRVVAPVLQRVATPESGGDAPRWFAGTRQWRTTTFTKQVHGEVPCVHHYMHRGASCMGWRLRTRAVRDLLLAPADGSQPRGKRGAELYCPVCAPPTPIVPSYLAPASCSTMAARLERKVTSANKWLALATTMAEAEAREAASKKKRTKPIRALVEREAAALSPGWLRGDRIERLNEAACTDDVLRLLGIIEAGVDIDGCSECGETAAISAAMLGNVDSLRVLCWAGADLSLSDAIGATPASAAAARGYEATLAVVNEFCSEKSSTVSVDSSGPARSGPPRIVSVEPEFQCLIDRHAHSAHPGCGSGYADRGFSREWLQRLQDTWEKLPTHVADTTAGNTSSKSYTLTCANRSLFCDAEGWVEAELAPLAEKLLLHTAATGVRVAELKVLPRMRFLSYTTKGGSMQPHVDLAKRDPSNSIRLSTHTFMVHLADCKSGGETVLFKKLVGAVAAVDASELSAEGKVHMPDGVLAAVSPVRGRLLIFPHACPHAGLPVKSVPKLFLRGELLVRWEEVQPHEVGGLATTTSVSQK